VVAIPRGNGKSTLAAALGLWALVDGPEGAQVPIAGGVSERQSRICFDTARRMVQLDAVSGPQDVSSTEPSHPPAMIFAFPRQGALACL
jgi:phage terminase large subunit-like protein